MSTTTRDISTEPTELYRYFDSDDRLLYIGISLSTIMRATGHRRDAGWWNSWTRCSVERFDTRTAALAAERDAIIGERPLHNVVHNRINIGEIHPAPDGDLEPIYDHARIALSQRTQRLYAVTREVIDKLCHAVNEAIDDGSIDPMSQDDWIALVADMARYNVYADSSGCCRDDLHYPILIEPAGPSYVTCHYVCLEHRVRWKVGWTSNMSILAAIS